MLPIPDHLLSFPWYAPHQAWLKENGFNPSHDPGDALPARIDLGGPQQFTTYLRGANLSGADLRLARMDRTVLTGANLTDARFNLASLYFSDLSGAVLDRCVFQETDLRHVFFYRAEVTYAQFKNCPIDGCEGLNSLV